MSSESEPNPGESELIHFLQQEPQPVTLVAMARREKQYDTAYDHFLYDYVGDPFHNEPPTIERHVPFIGERRYTERLLASYSKEGSLVLVRGIRTIHHEHRAQDFFVVTADLHEQTVKEWRVAEANFTGFGDTLQMELVLSEQHFDEKVLDASVTASDPLRQIIEQKGGEVERQKEQANRPRVTLTSQGCSYAKNGQRSESLAPLYELVRKVDTLYARFGHVALLHSEKPESESADTIAA